MTTPTHAPAGHRRRPLAPAPATAESVPHRPQYTHYTQPPQYSPQPPYPQQTQSVPPPPQPVPQQDPPIYRALLRHWAERGRTLPGRHDPEWVRLAAPPVRSGQFGGHYGTGGDGTFGTGGDNSFSTGTDPRFGADRDRQFGTDRDRQFGTDRSHSFSTSPGLPTDFGTAPGLSADQRLSASRAPRDGGR
ncbi:hypothetical protein [Streptomyces lasiicapitis]|uniref:Uncharacterized protein n=1 Tax=Streptomyces lasiicapitis TaxID=1923961 RepID=A0ABQ2MEZ7_9ACTN|nr:hypothetical protein [Streptomyces lasiicapitis]GGO50885.1 hypothetical protein GCM10012286_52280 [Streptomyces lasiicapitis]